MKPITTFAEAQAALRPLYGTSRPNYDLGVMQRLMEFLGNPQDKLRVVHVAGTSGKTSTAYYISALLRGDGSKVGLTVSPHVDEMNERVQINGEPLAEAEFCRELEVFLRLVQQSELQLSYFECMVGFAYWEFAKQEVGYGVVEVGLGGLLDGTNVVTREDKVCVITDIGLDHTEVLGETLAEIAVQKAGIILPRNHIFMYEQGREVMDAVTQASNQQSAILHVFPASAAIAQTKLPLFQRHNLGLAVQAVNYVRNRDGKPTLSNEEIEAAAGVRIPARMEQFELADKTLVIDGSHNAQKLAVLAESIGEKYPDQKVAALVAFVEGNTSRWQGGVDQVMKLAERIIITSFQAEQDVPKKSVEPATVAEYCLRHGYTNVTVLGEPAKALSELRESKEPLLLVAGSFYLLNHIRPLLAQ